MVPVAPIASPPRVRVSTSAVSASGVSGSAVSRPSAASSTGCSTPPSNARSSPSAQARYQSAGAVQAAVASPTPARVSRSGAPRSTSWSMISALGQVLGTVRLAPLRTSTDSESA